MQPKAFCGGLLGVFCLAVYCLCGAEKFLGSGTHEWRKLIMVHHWPPTVCKDVENDCTNPPDYWTIHGLWPDKAEECNRSWHFNLDEIKDLLPDMKMYWPDVIHQSSNRSHFCPFFHYLNSSVLQKLGIKPSINYYQISDIKDALAGVYGVIPKVQCLPPKQNEDVQTIGQIELCLTKDFRLRNCSEPGPSAVLRQKAKRAEVESVAEGPGLEVCEDGPVFYPPPGATTR
ncbi:ribonuclease T2 [Orycteropus afer afer]|uniref:Ribonuclease T2 n=1 Tax=Orycteropus afer afer TaxID=1230840 RepID=A0A8B7AR36_ORYAF|nr:ribonuclease T2 [Orycteropus afer afer]